MKSSLFVLLAMMAFAASAAAPSPLKDNPYAPGIQDMVLGWTDSDMEQQCRQKLPSVVTAYQSLLQKLVTFDFEQIDPAVGTLYSTYTAFPMCSYTTNVLFQAGYLFVYNILLDFVALLGPQMQRLFYSLERLAYSCLLYTSPSPRDS